MSHKSIKKLQKQVNYKINQVGKWMNANKLTISYSKSNFMLFTNKKKKGKFKLEINNNQITESDSVKYLGVIIDNKLNWKTHIEHICSKIVKGSWALTRLKKYVSKQTLIKIYYSMIYLHLRYCITTWGSASKITLMPLIKLQKRFVRKIGECDYRDHTEPLFQEMKLLTLSDIYFLETAISMHRIHYKKHNITSNLFKTAASIHKHYTRYSDKDNYYLQPTNLSLGRKAIIVTGTVIWAKIPPSLKKFSPKTFAKKLKDHLISKKQGTITT